MNPVLKRKQEIDGTAERKRSFVIWISVVVLLGIFAAQNIYEARRETCTSDEVVHLPAGLTYLLKRDFRLNPEHPPLIKILCALPVLALHPKIDFNDPNWIHPSQSRFGFKVLYSNDADRMLFWGRAPAILLAVLLGFFVFRWSQQLYGDVPGLFALALYTFSPNIIAHSHFVTTDVGVATFLTMSFYFLWRYTQKKERWSGLGSAVSMGLALASKFSAVVYFPVAALLLWVFHPSSSGREMDAGAGSGAGASEKKNKRGGKKGSQGGSGIASAFKAFLKSLIQMEASRVLAVLIFLVVACGIVQLSYLGSRDLSLYYKGIQQVNRNHVPGYLFYLHGRFQEGGFWNYFLVAFLVKATAPFIMLVFMRVGVFLRHIGEEGKTASFLLFPSVIYFIAVSALADPLGVRYLLPIFPFLMVFSSGLVARAMHRKVIFASLWILLAWHVITSMAAFPHHLSYFNEFVGGPSHGMEWLDDSNVDWGQELKSLKKVLDERHITHIILISFSPFDNPQYYGIDCTRPDMRQSLSVVPGIYAISASSVARMRALGFDWMERYPVIANLGYSMFLFRVP